MCCRNELCPFSELGPGVGPPSSAIPTCLATDLPQRVTFEPGHVLFLQGQSSSTLYSLIDGIVKICSHTADGHEQIVGLSSPDNLLVGVQSMNENRYAYTAVAATHVTACRISHRDLLAHMHDNPDLALHLIDAANAQLAHSRALMEVMGLACASAKIASLILLLTPKSMHGNCGFAMPLSRREIANILGLSEETVCRLMANMKRSGAIYAPRGKMEIRNWRQLQSISAGAHLDYHTH